MFYSDDPERDFDRYMESLENKNEFYTDDDFDLVDRKYDEYIDRQAEKETNNE